MRTTTKYSLIFILLMAIVAINYSSCEEKEVEVSTFELMQGNWKCVKTEYNNKTYYSCQAINSDPDVKDMKLMMFNIRIFKADLLEIGHPLTVWQIIDVCRGFQYGVAQYGFGGDNKYGENEIGYQVLKVNKTTLIMNRYYMERTIWDEATNSHVKENIPVNAVYTFERLPT